MDFYFVKNEYIEFLRQYDPRVPNNKDQKRPYIGIVLAVDNINYFAPLTSPKRKHLYMKNNVDFRKIGDGSLGAINFNNMIPVVGEALIPISIKSQKNVNYRRLLQNQYEAILSDEEGIRFTARKLRNLLISNSDVSLETMKIINRCCNLCVLEKCYLNYKK